MTKKWVVLPFLVTEDDIMQLVVKWMANWILPMDVIEGIMGNSAEGTTNTSKLMHKEKKKVTIDLEKNTVQKLESKHDKEPHTKELDQGTKDPFVDLENIGSPFILKS